MTGVGSDRVGSEAAGPLSGRASPTADPARSWSVYTHLLLFALAIAIPVVLTGIGLFVAGNQDERRELEKRLEVMALEFSRDIERDISSLATTLEVIALTPSLLSGDVETFQSFAVEVARRQNVNIILRAPTGEHVFNTRAPVDGGYSRSGMTLVDREGISKGKPYVTDVFVSAMRNQPIFIVSVPLKTGSYAGYTLNAAVEPTIFNLHVQFWNIPPGWTVRIYDRKRTPVFGSTFDGGVQTPMLDQSALKTLTAPGGTMEAKATSGESLLIGYQRIQISDWLVTVEMLSPSLVKLSTRRFQLLASLSIILLICSAALAAWFARRIAKPVGQLAQQANMLGSAETPNVQRLGIREIDDVLVRLSEASARLASSHAELRKSDDRLRLALEIGRMGTASWDIAGGSMELDAIGAAIYGLDQRTTQIALDSIVEFTIPEDRAAARSFFAKTSRSPDAITIRISRANDGAERFIAIRAQQSEPRPTKAGMSERVIGIIFDITEQKVAERGLEQLNLVLEQRVVERTHALELANSRLREEMAQREAAMAQLTQAQKLEALGQLTSSVAHDFNNQLLAILGGLELVSKQVDDPRLVRHIRNARSAARRASQLTDQLLSFSRRADLQPSNIHVADALAELDEVLRHAAGAKVTRSTDIAPETHAVWADPDQLHATLVNIAINARDAMPDGGELRITARNVDASQVPPDLGLPAEDFVVIAVSDTGIGMSEDVLRHATEPFFTTKPRGKGTGLGLAMARTFAEQSHGGLHISSSPGHGTTVEIYLPVAKALPKRAAAAAVVPPPPVTTNWLALCVDDDRQAVAVTAAFLGEMGMKVISDTDPASALDKIKSIDSLDLLVSDIDMPDIDGVEMAARVRKLFPGVEVLLVTGHQDHEVRLRGGIESVPGAALLRKPFSSADLAAKIASMTRSETSTVGTVPANRRVAQR